MNTPQILPILHIEQETPTVKTFYFSHALGSSPGQFVMLWVPGFDQKPFSIGYDNGKEFGLTIFAVGPATEQIFTMKPGDRVGVTGPYGKPFSIRKDTHYILVGGGYGAAPLGFLAEQLIEHNATIDVCLGGRNEANLLFEHRMSHLPRTTLHIATDDGSKGHKGYVTDLLEQILHENIKTLKHKNILVSTCGPELMEKKVLDVCNKYDVECEISIERYMKCGFGICGQCCMDPLGIALCVDGPVVSKDIANQLTEFGKYHRDKSGTKISY